MSLWFMCHHEKIWIISIVRGRRRMKHEEVHGRVVRVFKAIKFHFLLSLCKWLWMMSWWLFWAVAVVQCFRERRCCYSMLMATAECLTTQSSAKAQKAPFSVWEQPVLISAYLFLLVTSTSDPGCVSPNLVIRGCFLRKAHRREGAPSST